MGGIDWGPGKRLTQLQPLPRELLILAPGSAQPTCHASRRSPWPCACVGGQVLGQTQLSEQGCLQRGHLLHTQEDVLLTPFGLQDPDSKYISN